MRIAALALAVSSVLCAAPARAQQEPFTLDKVTLAGGVRWGTEDMNLGVGARAGYTLSQAIYVGGIFDYWFGESTEVSLPGGPSTSVSASAWDVLGEAGYDFGITPVLVIRPFGGFGFVHLDGEICTSSFAGQPESCIDVSDESGVGEVGGLIFLALEDGFNISGEVRVMFAEETVVVFGANAGADF